MDDSDRDMLALALHSIEEAAEIVRRVLNDVPPDTWAFPVGSEKFPVGADDYWYCAQFHTYVKNVGGHTGIDLNGDRPNWGNVDLGEPGFAITAGIVHEVGYSQSWGCNVVLLVQHEENPLWVRYAHLDRATVTLKAGDPVRAGDKLGGIGPHPNGAHLHFDMALDAFGWPYYRTSWVPWVDPVPILEAHLDPLMVKAMLAKKK